MFLILALTAAAAATPAGASGFQSTALLDTIVAQFTGRDIGDKGGARAPVDTRLKLAACTAPQLEWYSDAKDAVVVRCMAPTWKIFVPVNALPQPKPAPAAGVAVVAQRPATPIKVEPVIRRGDPITVEAGSAGFSITREGVAMGDARPGERLLVKIDTKKTPIQAVAIEQGHATLPGWED